MTMRTLLILLALPAVLIVPMRADDSDRLLTIDHYVQVRSTVPALVGQPAPAYNRGSAAGPPAAPAEGVAFNTQSRADYVANWERQVACAGQVDPAVADVAWSEMLASDPVGATWGPGVRRAPQTATWGWNAAAVAKAQTPTLMIAPANDRQVDPDRVRELHADLGTSEKVLLDLGCASHNAMWEKNRLLLLRASLEWLEKGSVNGEQRGIVRLGYPETPSSASARPD